MQSDAVARLGPDGITLTDTARRAFVDGLSVATMVAAGTLLVAAAGVYRFAPRRTDPGLADRPRVVPPADGHETSGPGLPSR